jgi:hypothetical protein
MAFYASDEAAKAKLMEDPAGRYSRFLPADVEQLGPYRQTSRH